jgi:hypothetical protein
MVRLTRLIPAIGFALVFSTLQSEAQGLPAIAGNWVNTKSDHSIMIRDSGFGYDAWIDNFGRARIAYSTCGGGNIYITNGNQESCCFYTSITGRTSMVWQLRSGAPACPQLRGTFHRTQTP